MLSRSCARFANIRRRHRQPDQGKRPWPIRQRLRQTRRPDRSYRAITRRKAVCSASILFPWDCLPACDPSARFLLSTAEAGFGLGTHPISLRCPVAPWHTGFCFMSTLTTEFSPRFQTILLVDQVAAGLVVEKWTSESCSK